MKTPDPRHQLAIALQSVAAMLDMGMKLEQALVTAESFSKYRTRTPLSLIAKEMSEGKEFEDAIVGKNLPLYVEHILLRSFKMGILPLGFIESGRILLGESKFDPDETPPGIIGAIAFLRIFATLIKNFGASYSDALKESSGVISLGFGQMLIE